MTPKPDDLPADYRDLPLERRIEVEAIATVFGQTPDEVWAEILATPAAPEVTRDDDTTIVQLKASK